MKRLALFILLFYATQQISFAQLQKSWTWSHSFGSPGADRGVLAETDPDGNVYTVTLYRDTMTVWGKSFPKPKWNWNYVLVKHDADGNFIYAQDIYADAHASYVNVYGIDVDDSGQVYIVGDFRDTLTVGSLAMSGGNTNNYNESFIAKLGKNGNTIWLRKLGGLLDDHLSDVVIDHAGDIIVTGYFYDYNRQYDTFKVSVPKRGENFLLVKLTAGGQYKWVKHSIVGQVGISNGTSQTYPARIEVDKNNNIYVAARVDESISFNGLTYDIQGMYNMFIAKFNSTGNYLWNDVAEPKYCDVRGMAIDNNDKIYVSGRYRGDSLYFRGSDTLRSDEFYAYYLAKYNTSGTTEWVRGFDTDNADQYRLNMATDQNNNVLIAGIASGAWRYNSDTLFSFSSPTTVVVTMSDQGTITRVDSITGYAGIADIATDLSNNVYAIGNFGSYLRIGDSLHYDSNVRSANIFIAKLEHQPIVTLNGINKSSYCVGDSITVYFSNDDTVFAGSNQFHFEMSDASGSFISPVALGSYTTIAVTDSAKFILPASITAGTGYRVRIRSTEPIYYTAPGISFDINNLPTKPTLSANSTQLSANVSGAGTLQWYKNGTAIAGATSATFQPQSAGMYTISHTNNAGCTAVSNPLYFTPVSVESIELNNAIMITPNPAHTTVTLQGLKGATVIEVYDLVGKVVYQQNALELPTETIDISNLSTGNYIIRITYSNGERTTAKMVKQ